MILIQQVLSVINPTGEPKNDVNVMFDYSRKKYRVTSRLKQMRAPPMLLRKCSYCMKVCGGEGLVFTARWCLEILTKTCVAALTLDKRTGVSIWWKQGIIRRSGSFKYYVTP